MLPDKTLSNLKSLFASLCNLGSLPYAPSQDSGNSVLSRISSKNGRDNFYKLIVLSTSLHTVFIIVRLFQAYESSNQKFYLTFIHFAWVAAFILTTWLHSTLYLSRHDILAFCNGLFQFYGSYVSMPGATDSGKLYDKWLIGF